MQHFNEVLVIHIQVNEKDYGKATVVTLSFSLDLGPANT